MPRAKRPESKRRTYRRQPFRLEAHARDGLAKRLGIADDASTVSAMELRVNDLLSTYFARLHHFEYDPTSNSLARALDPLHRKFIELRDSLNSLDPYSKEQLLVGVNMRDIDVRVLETLPKTLGDIAGGLGSQLDKLRGHKTSNRRVNWPLRLAIDDLFYTFTTFHQQQSKKFDRRRCRGFVIAALGAAGISRERVKNPLDDALARFLGMPEMRQ